MPITLKNSTERIISGSLYREGYSSASKIVYTHSFINAAEDYIKNNKNSIPVYLSCLQQFPDYLDTENSEIIAKKYEVGSIVDATLTPSLLDYVSLELHIDIQLNSGTRASDLMNILEANNYNSSFYRLVPCAGILLEEAKTYCSIDKKHIENESYKLYFVDIFKS